MIFKAITYFATTFTSLLIVTNAKEDDFISSEITQSSEIIDMHLHLAPWFEASSQLKAELATANVSRGIIYAVYPPIDLGLPDANEEVSRISLESNGTIYGLASLNTTDWNTTRDFELDRLHKALQRPEFVGTKLANPHTCLPLQSPIMADILEVVASSSKPVLGVHVGTTPFCIMDSAVTACCERDYVDPLRIEDFISFYRNVTFVLLHSGFDFLPAGHALNYNGSLVKSAIGLAKKYPNVILETSAMHAQYANGTLKYPGGDEVYAAMHDANVSDRVIWGSDANHQMGFVKQVLESSIRALRNAGFSQEERCWALSGASRHVFGLDEVTKDGNDEASASGSTWFVPQSWLGLVMMLMGLRFG